MQDIISTQLDIYAEDIIRNSKSDPYHRIEEFINKIYEEFDCDMFKYNWFCQNGLIYDIENIKICYGKHILQLYKDVNIFLKKIVDEFFEQSVVVDLLQYQFNKYMDNYNIKLLASLHICQYDKNDDNIDFLNLDNENNIIISCIEFEKDEHYYFMPVSSQRLQKLICMFRNTGHSTIDEIVDLTYFNYPKYTGHNHDIMEEYA